MVPLNKGTVVCCRQDQLSPVRLSSALRSNQCHRNTATSVCYVCSLDCTVHVGVYMWELDLGLPAHSPQSLGITRWLLFPSITMFLCMNESFCLVFPSSSPPWPVLLALTFLAWASAGFFTFTEEIILDCERWRGQPTKCILGLTPEWLVEQTSLAPISSNVSPAYTTAATLRVLINICGYYWY